MKSFVSRGVRWASVAWLLVASSVCSREAPSFHFRRGQTMVAARRFQLRETQTNLPAIEPGTELVLVMRESDKLAVSAEISPEDGLFRFPRWANGWINQKDAVPGRGGKHWWAHLLPDEQRHRLTELAVEGLQSRKYGLPTAAASLLGHLNAHQAARPLCDILEAKEHSLAWQAAQSLGKLGPEGQALLREALQHEKPEVRRLAAEALSFYGDEESFPALRAALQDTDARVREAVAQSLLRLGHEAIVAAVWQKGESVSFRIREGNLLDATLCELAADGLAKRGDAGIALLREGFKHSHPFVVRSVIITVGKFGYREFIPELRKAMESPDQSWAAVASLYVLGDEQVIPKIRVELGFSDPNRVAVAIERLNRAGDRESVPTIRRLLESRWPQVRSAAARALGSFEDGDSIPRLRAALHDEAGSVRAAAAWALGRLGDLEALPDLKQILASDPFDGARQSAAEAMSMFGEAGKNAVAEGLRSDSASTRWAVASALRYFDPDKGLALLSSAVADPVPRVRQAAVESLGRISKEEAIPLLAEACYDVSEGVSAAALHELLAQGWRPSSSMEDLLQVVVATEDVPILQMLTADAKPGLLALLSDERLRHKKAAKMLIRLGDKETIPDLIAYLNRQGDEIVTEWFANSQNAELSAAARKHAKARGYIVRTISPPKVVWGR